MNVFANRLHGFSPIIIIMICNAWCHLPSDLHHIIKSTPFFLCGNPFWFLWTVIKRTIDFLDLFDLTSLTLHLPSGLSISCAFFCLPIIKWCQYLLNYWQILICDKYHEVLCSISWRIQHDMQRLTQWMTKVFSISDFTVMGGNVKDES